MSGVHDCPFPELNSFFNSQVISIVAIWGIVKNIWGTRRVSGQTKFARLHQKLYFTTENLLVQNTICISGSRANAEKVTIDSCCIIVDVKELRPSLIPTSDHRPHAETVSTILIPSNTAKRGNKLVVLLRGL
jgi:hypothetical protein